MNPNVQELLLSDLEAKCMELIQEARKFMHHSKRDVMTTNDMRLAMEKLSLPETFGYPSSVPYTYERSNDANADNLWFIKPANVSLKEYISKPQALLTPLDTVYEKDFLSIDGNGNFVLQNYLNHNVSFSFIF